MTLDGRIQAIQEESQQFPNPNEVVPPESNEQQRLLRISLRICGTVVESLPMARCAPKCEKTVQAFLCRNLNVKSATLPNATSSRRIRLQDDLVTAFHLSVSERFVPGSTLKVSIVELIREGLGVLKMATSYRPRGKSEAKTWACREINHWMVGVIWPGLREHYQTLVDESRWLELSNLILVGQLVGNRFLVISPLALLTYISDRRSLKWRGAFGYGRITSQRDVHWLCGGHGRLPLWSVLSNQGFQGPSMNGNPICNKKRRAVGLFDCPGVCTTKCSNNDQLLIEYGCMEKFLGSESRPKAFSLLPRALCLQFQDQKESTHARRLGTRGSIPWWSKVNRLSSNE
ncbi:hypothetical protein SASPL_155513 (mitochondrion) [Salvia splendens]|uniref:ATP synthase protein MI25 n=1 Tax=Salvia splendens TaxID=180675 RepID=A0A8X8VWW0_SALSN|nr:hypothetical protein SASPL_156290 [Salvia splendens]KAG6383898.1 hypothetical protein SASPL_156320 [Salvia splendens]KAG6383924.1 hypothetical protein SASPL_156353 [Salvia splendens]KAG6384640.1 hypothetical protein SASPL_155483 [Salvia splendens]KAG6384661.1 hypothetical protein SASPL_155513 [Salvia splendens]